VCGLPSSWTEDDEEEVEETELGMATGADGSFTLGTPEGDSVAMLCDTVLLERCSERLSGQSR